MNSYLKIAEAVLRESKLPLSAVEILDTAYRLQLVPDHLFGKTQYKTLHARLAEDILRNRRHTVFARTAPGRFVLRGRIEDRRDESTEYVAPLRSYQLKQFDVVCAECDELESLWQTKAVYTTFTNVASAFSKQLPFLDVETDFTVAHLRVMVTVRCLDRFLTMGSLAGSRLGPGRTLGFFGFLKGMDADLFSQEPFGVDEAARRTMSEQTTLGKDGIGKLEELIAYESLRCIRLLDNNDVRNSVVLLTAYECKDPDYFIAHIPNHRAPRWARLPSEINDTMALEPVSRHLVQNGHFLSVINS